VGKTKKVQTLGDSARRFNFTQRAIAALPTPKEKRGAYRDLQTRELGLLVQPSGHRAYFWYRKLRGVPTWKTIGDVEDTPLDRARDQARAYSHAAAEWKRNNYKDDNPLEPPRDEPTFEKLIDDYCEKRIRAHSNRPERAEHIPSSSINSRNHCIEPVASIPTRVGRGRVE